MKTYLILILILFTLNETLGQNAFYDAMYYSKLTLEDCKVGPENGNISKSEELILGELANYLKDPFNNPEPNITRVKIIFNKIDNANKINLVASGFAGASFVSLVSSFSGLSKLSGLSSDTLLTGLAVSMGDKFRKGYTQTYLNFLQETIGGVGELQILFPQTFSKIRNIDTIRYKEFGNEIKGVFDEDLKSSVKHIIDFIEDPKFKEETKLHLLTKANCESIRNGKEFHSLKMASEIADKAISGVHPSDMLSFIDEKYYSMDKNDKLNKFFHLLNILQLSVQDTSSSMSGSNSRTWINMTKLSELRKDKVLKFYIAKLYNEDKYFFDTKFMGINLSGIDYSTEFDKLKWQILVPLLSTLNKIDDYQILKKESIQDEKNFQTYISLIGNVFELAKKNELTKNSINIDIFNEVFEIYNGIKVKNYSNLGTHTINLLKLIAKDATLKFEKQFDNLVGFGSTLINAKTSEDVNLALKKYADPPISYLTKRNNKAILTLGGMPGIYIAREKPIINESKVDISTIDDKGKGSFGISLPIGLDWSFCNSKKCLQNWSVFFQAIDLGTMLNYYLKDRNISLPQKVSWDAVMSPGISLVYGFPNSPWNIQGGYQMGPKLRDFSKDQSKEMFSTNRWQIRLSYDIPLKKVLGRK